MILAGSISGNIAQTHLTAFAEVGTWSARGSIQRNESRVESGFEDTPPRGSGGFGTLGSDIGTGPGCDPTINQSITVVPRKFSLGIVSPALSSGFRIERDHAIERRGEVKGTINQDRCGFKTTPLPATVAVRDIAGVKNPRDLELRHVLAIDLSEWRVSQAARVVTVIRPFVALRRTAQAGDRYRGNSESAEQEKGHGNETTVTKAESKSGAGAGLARLVDS